jgi:hypothetical protein
MYIKSYVNELRNLYKHYTLSTYLAVTPKRMNLVNVHCIDLHTGIINLAGVTSLIEAFISAYSEPVTPKIKSIYGIGYYKNYFELYEFIKNSKKHMTFRSLEFLKEEGKRCFYYALRNFNESMHYKEGLLFAKVLLVYKQELTIEDLLVWIQNIVSIEATERLQKDLITRRLVDKNIEKTHFDKLSKAAASVPVPSFQEKKLGSDTIVMEPKVFKERNEAKRKFNQMLLPYKDGTDLVLGYQDKGMFNGKTNCLNLNINDKQEGVIIAGEDSSPKELLRSYIYQSVYSSSGFLLFSPLSDKSTLYYIFQVAKHFDITDNVHVFYFGSEQFHQLDINAYVRANKIVLVLYPDFSESLHNERTLIQSYHSINTIISSINVNNIRADLSKFPFNIYLSDISFCDSVECEIIKIVDSLTALYQYNINYYIVNENLQIIQSSYKKLIFERINNFIVLNNQRGHDLCNTFDSKKIKPIDFTYLEPLAFYYFSHNVLVNHNKFHGIYMPIDIEINLDECLI